MKLRNNKNDGEIYKYTRDMTVPETRQFEIDGTEPHNLRFLFMKKSVGYILFMKLISPLTHIE